MNDSELLEICEAHLIAKTNLDTAKKLEMKLRKEICKELVDIDGGSDKKSKTVGEYKVTATAKSTYSIEKDDDGEMVLDQDIIEDMDDISRDCISIKISLVSSKIKKVIEKLENGDFEDGEVEIIDYITESPATPTLAIKLLN